MSLCSGALRIRIRNANDGEDKHQNITGLIEGSDETAVHTGEAQHHGIVHQSPKLKAQRAA